MNKKLLIGLGVVAAAGVGYYLWKRKKDSETETTKTPLDNREEGVKLTDALPKKVANTTLLTKKPIVAESALIKTAAPRTA